MSKRKKTDIVSLKLRIRETLRKRIETAAKAEERSLNSEMASRLANSFDRVRDSELLEVLLAPGDGLELLRAIATVLKMSGPDWAIRQNPLWWLTPSTKSWLSLRANFQPSKPHSRMPRSRGPVITSRGSLCWSRDSVCK